MAQRGPYFRCREEGEWDLFSVDELHALPEALRMALEGSTDFQGASTTKLMSATVTLLAS
jgi:hypothetical protein